MIDFTPSEVANYYTVRVPALPQRGIEWRGPCPIHRGKDANFAVNSKTGQWRCHSQCGRGGDIISLEQDLATTDFRAAKASVFQIIGRPDVSVNSNGKAASSSKAWKVVEEYPYMDTAGDILFRVVRYLKPDGQKIFQPYREADSPSLRAALTKTPSKTRVWGLAAGRYWFDPKFQQVRPGLSLCERRPAADAEVFDLPECPRVPYRLPKVLQAETVYLVEGEKDVDTLEAWGLVASCNPGGCGSSRLYAKWLEHFQGRRITILPDNDGPGRKHAATVAAALLSVAGSVRIVELPGLPEKGDVTDWRDAGGTPGRFRELTDAAAPMDAAALSELRVRWGLVDGEPEHRAARVVSNEWPKPEPMRSELPPVQAFSDNLLPDSFRTLVADVTERMQVPMDYPAVVMVLCLAGAVNRRAIIQPKANDTGWVVVPNLWGGIIAPPGFMKSPVIQAVTRPLTQIQTEWRQEHEEALKAFGGAQEEYQIRYAAWKEQYKANTKRGKAAPDRPEDELEAPKLRRLIVNDATFEALHQTMSENPAGILVTRDELPGWWSELDRAGREGERAFCLQAWNGDTGHTIDRIGRGTIHVEACCISMLGGIQPGKLRSYLVDALKDGPSNDGLIQRFQLLVWPDTAREFIDVDRAPDAASEQQAARVFRKLVELDAENPTRYRFTSDAQELFIEWRAELEAKVRGNELHPALISHLSKYRSLMPALALLFHMAEAAAGNGGADTVSLRHAQQAAGWCEYLESHARRVYSCIATPQQRAALELAEHIKKRHIRNKDGGYDWFAARDVYLKGWTGLDTPDATRITASVLEDAGWVRAVNTEGTGGRPGVRYEVNPGVWV